jgi:hypothetical protein
MAKSHKTMRRVKAAGISKAEKRVGRLGQKTKKTPSARPVITKRGKSASHSRRTNGFAAKRTSAQASVVAIQPTTDMSVSLDSLRVAVRTELAELLWEAVGVLSAQHSANRKSLTRDHVVQPKANPDGVTPAAAIALPEISVNRGTSDEHISDANAEELPENPGLRSSHLLHSEGDHGDAPNEAFDAQAREMFAAVETRSQMQSACSPLQIVDFLIEKKAFSQAAAVKTKDLPKARSTKRSASRNFLEELGAIKPVKVTPVRPKKQGTQRPSRRRVDGVFLTPLAIRGWELRYNATLVHS